MRAPKILLGVTLLVAGQAPAMANPTRLAVMVDATTEAGRCGLGVDAMKSAVRAAMRYNRIEEGGVPEVGDELVYITTSALALPQGCVGNISLWIEKFDTTTRADGKSQVANVVYCFEATIQSDSHQIDPTETIRRQFDQCLSEMQDNAAIME